MNLNVVLVQYLAGAIPVILVLSQLIKTQVKQIPDKYTCVLAFVLSMAFGLALVGGLLPAYPYRNNTNWEESIMALIIYSGSHSGLFELLFKDNQGLVAKLINTLFTKPSLTAAK